MRRFWLRLKPIRVRLLLLLSVLGPGIITANADNDAGGITAYSVAGADYGYGFLWMLPLVGIALVIVQEMTARLGVVTGKGLADLIRENLGLHLTTLVLGILMFVNLANTVSEFAGVAASLEIFGISKFISVPIAGFLVWLLIVKGNYKTVERVFLFASAIYFAYIISGVLADPPWEEVGLAFITPTFPMEVGYVTLFVTIIGTTIAPWMQFYQQAAIVDKGIKPSEYKYARLDVVVGSIFAVVIAAFIIIACSATLHQQGIHVDTAANAALALRPLAGKFASALFALGLLNASVFAAAVLPLSSAYTICEAFGWESSVSRSWKEAPVFFLIFTAMIILGGGIVLLPLKSLIEAMLVSQTLNGLLLPIILLVMLKLINKRSLMGRFTNGRIFNIFAWITTVILIGLALYLIVITFIPGFS